MRGLIDAREPMPISLFFDYFQLTAGNTALGSQLRGRGIVSPTSGNLYKNSGRLIDTIIKDIGPERRQVTIYVNGDVIVTATANGVDLQFDFREGDVVNKGISDLPAELGFGTSFLLASITWDDSGVRYIAREDGEPDHEIQILVDPTLQDAVFLSGLRGFRARTLAPMRMIPLGLHALSDSCAEEGSKPSTLTPHKGRFALTFTQRYFRSLSSTFRHKLMQ